ncbi:unnamed protein product [Closterium sp. NIES-53]
MGVVAAVIAVAVELFGGKFLAVASCSDVSTRPFHPSSYESGNLAEVVAAAVVAVARAEFGDAAELPCWQEMLPQGVDIFPLDYDAILTAIESALLGTAPTEALHTFILASGASRCFFRDNTTLTPLFAPVPVKQADPSGGPVLARSSTVLLCLAVPSGSLSGPVAPPCSCRLLSHRTLLWHHRLGHPSLPRLCGMHTRLLISGLPRSLPPLPPSPTPPCLPCNEGQQRVAPHSSFPPTIAPLQTLHMDVLGPAHVSGQGREHYFLMVVDDYTRYTMVFPLRSKGEVPDVLIPWIRAVRLQLRERFQQELPVLRLHSDRGGEFSSDLLWDFCHGEGILQSFTLPASPQQNGIAECRIGLVMEVWGSHASVCDTCADKLSAHAIPCVFLGFPPDALDWQFYHPTSHRVLPSQDITFPFYHLFPYHSALPPPPPLFLAPGPPPVDPLSPHGPAPSGVAQVDPLLGTVPIEVAEASGAARGAASGGAASGGAEPGGAESEGAGSGGAVPGGAEPGGAELVGVEHGGAQPTGVEPGGAEPKGVEPGGAESKGAESGGNALGVLLLLEVLRRTLFLSGAARAGDSATGDTGGGGAGVLAGAGGTGGTAAADPGGAGAGGTGARGAGARGAGAGHTRAVGAGAGGTGAGGARAGGAGAGDTGAVDLGAGGAGAGGALSRGTGAGGTVRPRPFFVPLLHQVLSSSLPAPSPYAEHTDSFANHHEPESRPASPIRAVCIGSRVPCPRPPPVPGTHTMALRPSSVLLRVPLPAPPESSLPAVPDLEFDLARAAIATVSRLLATVVTHPSFESIAASALVAQLVDFAAAYCLDYATALIAESEPASPPSVADECALGTDVLEDRVKRPPGSPPAFNARYVARGFSQRQGVDYFQTFSPTPKMTTLRVLLHVAAQRDYELHYLDFSTAFLQGSLHEEIWLHRPPSFTGSFPAVTQWSLRRLVYGLRQAPREWHNTLRTTFAALGFTLVTTDMSLFLRTDTSLPPFYVLVYVLQCFGFQFSSPQPTPLSTSHSLSAPPSDESVEPSGPYPKLVGCLITSGMGLVLGGRGQIVLTGHPDASWVDDSATQRSSQGYTFSLGSGSLSWWSTRSSSVLSSSCEAEIYAGAMAAHELCWLTYLLTDLGGQPRSPPVLYVDNKTMIALCKEHRVEHQTKHITLRYFFTQELQQRG